MRLTVNLATRPFVELRSFFLRLRIVMALLLLVGIAVAGTKHSMQVKLDQAQAQMDRLHGQTTAAQQEKLHNEARMRQPVNAAVLDRAHFLNRLFLTKSFSWTAVMMDLENVLPTGVQVTAIEPQITGDGDVVIRLRVAGDRDRAVQLVRNLERSRRFLSPRLNAENAQAKETSVGNGFNRNQPAVSAGPAGVDFEILANYNPVPPGEAINVVKPKKTIVSAAPRAKLSLVGPTAPAMGNGRYPRDGVVLRPYSAQGPQSAGAAGSAGGVR